MEAAACYVGECRGGARDAKIALTAEGIFGVFIYIATPLMFVAVLGLALTSIDPLTLYLSYTEQIFGQGAWEKWFIGIPLISGPGPLGAERHHGLRPVAVPGGRGRAAAALVRAQEPARRARLRDGLQRDLLGDPGPARLAGADLHHLQRRLPAVLHARHRRLLRLPAAAAGRGAAVPAADLRPSGARWLVFVVWTAIYFYGGWNSPKIVWSGPRQGPGLYLLGLLIVALYAPLYWWRARQDRRLAAAGQLARPGGGPAGTRMPRSGADPASALAANGAGAAAEPDSAGEPPAAGRAAACCSGGVSWDPPPSEPAGVLLASPGTPFSRAAVRRARELAAGQPVAVLSILKVYGSSFGLPNPGLLPTRRERDEQIGDRAAGHRRAGARGCTVDGQIAATRSAGRMIAKVARTRQVRYVVMDETAPTGMRKIIEGELTNIVRRRLRDKATLELVNAQSLTGS